MTTTKFLDKSIKLKTILFILVVLLVLSIPVYIYMLIQQGLLFHNGGVYSLNSPYVKLFPEDCKKYTVVASGGYSSETTSDVFLLKGRYRRIKINDPDTDYSSPSHITCLGYTVIGGLHETSIGIADFTHQFTNTKGVPLVTIEVKYNSKYKFLGNGKFAEIKETNE